MGAFRNGEYGMGILTIPSVLLNLDGQYLRSSTDAMILINNGLSTIRALKVLQEECRDLTTKGDPLPCWCDALLQEHLTKGVTSPRCDRWGGRAPDIYRFVGCGSSV